MSGWPSDWPEANRDAAFVSGVLRTTPEDFEVTETLDHEPSGAGEHLYLFVEKRGVTTTTVQRRLARALGARRVDVSYAGMKDRHAVVRQWFSVHGADDDVGELGPEVRVLRADRHARKLRRGALRSNRFRIRARRLRGDAGANLQQLRRAGAPNYFGPQRFGAAGGNVAAAREWARAGRPRVPRFTRGLHLSSLRAFLFNEVLGRRVSDGSWRTGLPGEALLDGAPSGPLWGRGSRPSTGVAGRLESEVAAAYPDVCEALEHVGLAQERRRLRVVPAELSWALDEDVLTVEFVLPKGVYATSVLREVGAFGDVVRNGVPEGAAPPLPARECAAA